MEQILSYHVVAVEPLRNSQPTTSVSSCILKT